MDPRVLRPCLFCGETKHLVIDEGVFEREAVRDGKVIEMEWDRHRLVSAEYVDAICCEVCHTYAALDVWNGARPASDYALLRDFEPEAVAA
jgi:hypothetical protein